MNGLASRKDQPLVVLYKGGRLLFLMYKNNLSDSLACSYLIISEDTKSFREIKEVADMRPITTGWVILNVMCGPWAYGGFRIHS